MNLPKTILVPTAFSEGAEAALDYAVALATKLDARVHLLNVVALQMLSAEMGVAVTASMVDQLHQANQKALDGLVAAHAGKCAFGPTLLESGDARTQIEAVAKKVDADLIVIGTHGRRGFKRLLLGSVAEAVARVAPCPVLLVRQEAS
jgi:nucleotide-binding universal stress UspA family protein